MRRCSSCRSLLLGDVELCPRCGAPVAVAVGVGPAVTSSTPPPTAAAWPPAPARAPTASSAPASWPPATTAPAPAATPPRAPSYGRLSIPSPVAAAPLGAAPAPVTPTPTAPAPVYDAWQPYVVEAPAKTAIHHNPWARVALAVAIVLVAGAAIMHLRSDPLPAGTSAFVAGEGVTYTSPDGAFQVQLPQQPQVQHQMLNVNGVRAPLYIGFVQANSYVIGVASIVSPVRFDRSRINDALDAMATQGAKSSHGTGLRKVMTMHGSQPAIDARFKVDGHVGHMLAVATDSSIILLIVYAKSGTDRLFKALDDSLIIR
jgi:hypothetical protein